MLSPDGTASKFKVVKIAIAREQTISPVDFYASLGELPTLVKCALHKFFLYVQGKVKSEGRKRFCYTSAEIHPYRTMQIGLVYGSESETIPTTLAIILGHDLREDDKVTREEVKGELERIVKETRADINVEAAAQGIETLTREEGEDYGTYLYGIRVDAATKYRACNKHWSDASYAKGCDGSDNLETAPHLKLPLGINEDTIEVHTEGIKKGLMIAGMIRELIQETEEEARLKAIEQAVLSRAAYEFVAGIEWITGVRELFTERVRATDQYEDYEREIAEYERHYSRLYKEVIHYNEDVVRYISKLLTNPTRGHPYASSQQILLQLLAHHQTGNPLAA